ncbi:MAG TPA: hypothetical protein DCS93_00660 [Microscillaceae bacterium]|nr:hypothetical protein [Microscillaceae bacterium]
MNKEIEGVDEKTFDVDVKDRRYAKDANNIYFM